MIMTPEALTTHGAESLPGDRILWSIAERQKPLGYCVEVVLVGDETDGYVASIAQLRGVVSEGDDAESAIRNIREAFRATIETYIGEGMPIPWEKPRPREPDEYRIRVAVNV